jgi:Ger(x)C family germination protein
MKPIKLKKVFHIILVSCLVSIFITWAEIDPVEQMDVEVALGTDLEKTTNNDYQYVITRNTYVFEEEKKRSSKVIEARGNSFGAARENRQQFADKVGISGLEKLYLLNENYAGYGIKTSLDILFKNPRVNDTGLFVICKNSSKDILEYNIPGYSSSADFIEGLIVNQQGINFFPDEFNVINIYVRMNSEGRNIVLPYIELKEEGIVITGEALFNKDKMTAKVDMKDSRMLNMLKYNNVKGILTIQKSPKEYIDFNAKAKRRIKCFKKSDKYNFIIDLKLEGDIISNTLNKSISKNSVSRKEFEHSMEEQVKQECSRFIDKTKNEYKVDCLELGRIAAAKYGRRKSNDWNNIISDSNIEVNVTVKVDKVGRGDF